MQPSKLTTIVIAMTLLLSSSSALAAWFEATGQAEILMGDKQAARQQATQEAIKQALLFAGASVKSVQSMANGLLEDDRFEIRASGEVHNIELIDEIHNDDYITVSIRADIFAQEALCSASDYKKNIVTTWYNIKKRQQAAVGELYDFGKVFAEKLQKESQNHAKYSYIQQIEPYYLNPKHNELKAAAYTLAQKTDTQYVLFGEIVEFGVETTKSASLAFWASDQTSRNLAINLTLYDGYSGEIVLQERQGFSSKWEFDPYQPINSTSQQLWASTYGLATKTLIESAMQKIDEAVSCLPAFGRVLNVANENLVINLGQQNGVKPGDKLTLFQVNQFFDSKNQRHRQFQLHPEQVVVQQVFADTAIMRSANGAPLANIQANDFVARR